MGRFNVWSKYDLFKEDNGLLIANIFSLLFVILYLFMDLVFDIYMCADFNEKSKTKLSAAEIVFGLSKRS